MSDVELFASEVEELKKHAPHLVLDVDWSTVVTLIASLQLALRHPGNKGHSASRMRGFVDQLIYSIGTIRPRLAELLRRGDDPSCDV